MTRSIATITFTLALIIAPTAFAQDKPGDSNGSSPQAGVAGPADGANGGKNTSGAAGAGTSTAPTSAGSMGTSKDTATGGNSGGTTNRN